MLSTVTSDRKEVKLREKPLGTPKKIRNEVLVKIVIDVIGIERDGNGWSVRGGAPESCYALVSTCHDYASANSRTNNIPPRR